MNLIYINSYYEPAFVYGGPVKAESVLHRALVDLGVKVTVLTTDANGCQRSDVPLGRPTDLDGIQVTYFAVRNMPPRNAFFSPDLARACTQQIKAQDLAVLSGFWSYGMGAAVAACVRSGVPYLIPTHGQLMPWALKRHRTRKNFYLALLGRRYLEGAAALHCATSVEADSLASLQLSTPSFVVPYGVELEYWSNLPKRGGLRGRLGIPLDVPLLLLLGRLHWIKRPDIALRAAAAASRSDTHLVLAGPDEGGLTSQLQAQAEELECAERVHFTGLLADREILQAFADADLLVMPSVMESFGMSAVEAMAAGLPILVSDSVPLGYHAEKAGAGRVVPGTTEAFTRGLVQLLNRPEQLKDMGEQARTLVEQEFDVSVVAQAMLEQYKAIVETGHPLPPANTLREGYRGSRILSSGGG
jgi:glycosyltransferase involved in cell wall biosynthesis